MTQSNRLLLKRKNRRVDGVLAIPNRGQILAVTSEDLALNIDYGRSERITGDRNNSASYRKQAKSGGGMPNEFSFDMNTPEIESAMFNQFQKIAEIRNNTADTEITGVTNSTLTVAIASGGAAFKAGHLALMEGFTSLNNAGVRRVASSSATSVVFASGSPILTDEPLPPQGAILKSVGFEGAAGDISCTATGLASTALNFTTLGLTIGAWLKIGGEAVATKFNTSAVNSYARITAISANAITLDNLPLGWAVDAGAGKAIRIWFSDHVKNGITEISHDYEKSFQGQLSPQYQQFSQLVANTMELSVAPGDVAKISFNFVGRDYSNSPTTIDASPEAVLDETPFTGVANIARVIEAGARISDANKATSFSMSINNNVNPRFALGDFTAFSVSVGDCDVTGNIETYFGNDTLLAKYRAGIKTSVGMGFEDITSKKAFFVFIPNARITSAVANAGGRNQDVMAKIGYTAEKSALNPYSVSIDKFYYLEN